MGSVSFLAGVPGPQVNLTMPSQSPAAHGKRTTSGEVVKKPASSNWKALAPLLKQGKAVDDTPDLSAPTPQTSATSEKELWFEVDATVLRRSQIESQVAAAKAAAGTQGQAGAPLPVPRVIDLFPKSPSSSSVLAGKYVAIDCEMVGVGPDGSESALARVSLVNYHGEVLMDRYVRPVERITDYRTAVSGIEPHHLKGEGVLSLSEAQAAVWELIQGKVLVGHSLKNDFRALLIEHPRKQTRDTSKYRPFRRIARGKSPSLRRLAKEFLGIDIQQGSHDSVDDARVAMLLYRAHKADWENYLFRGEGKVIKQKQRMRKRSGSALDKNTHLCC